MDARPSWRLEHQTDELTALARKLNVDHIRLIMMCTPEPTDLVSDFASRLVARTGLSKYQAEKTATEALILSRFPKLNCLFLEGHYTPKTVSRVLDDIAIVPDNLCDIVDTELVKALLPTIAEQHALSPRSAGIRVQRILERHCPERLSDPQQDPKNLDVRTAESGAARYSLIVSKQDHKAIKALIRATMRKYECTDAEALIRLILGKSKVKVTLNLYKDISSTAKELFAEGGWLQGLVADEWLERVTHVRMAGPSSTQGYSPTDAQRAYVSGRDGHCRFPGCEVPANECEIDHIHRYEDDGPTDTSNLHLLCKHHHRLKTAGSWDVTRYSDSTEVWTSHGDGHTVTTAPSGPLARTSFKQRLSRKVTVRSGNGASARS